MSLQNPFLNSPHHFSQPAPSHHHLHSSVFNLHHLTSDHNQHNNENHTNQQLNNEQTEIDSFALGLTDTTLAPPEIDHGNRGRIKSNNEFNCFHN